MSEQSQQNDSLLPEPAKQDLAALIIKMQQQLTFLEKKIDILINQAQVKPSGYPQRPFDRARVNPSGERSFGRRSHFERPRSPESRGFDYKKKIYDNSGKSEFSREHRFEKRPDAEKRSFAQKKPFSFKGKAHR